MSEAKEFPTAVIASLSSGVLLCGFDEMNQAAEYLMGHPIWTHHFASKNLWQEMQKTILEQCPGMPTAAPGITKDNWPEFKAKLEADLGEVVKIRKGGGLTAFAAYRWHSGPSKGSYDRDHAYVPSFGGQHAARKDTAVPRPKDADPASRRIGREDQGQR